jgi:hypothetical protein
MQFMDNNILGPGQKKDLLRVTAQDKPFHRRTYTWTLPLELSCHATMGLPSPPMAMVGYEELPVLPLMPPPDALPPVPTGYSTHDEPFHRRT